MFRRDEVRARTIPVAVAVAGAARKPGRKRGTDVVARSQPGGGCRSEHAQSLSPDRGGHVHHSGIGRDNQIALSERREALADRPTACSLDPQPRPGRQSGFVSVISVGGGAEADDSQFRKLVLQAPDDLAEIRG